MLTTVTTQLCQDLEYLKSIVRWQDELRATVHKPVASSAPLAIDANSLEVMRLRAPNRLAWQLFDHCAAVTRIYALFEKAICDLVEEYLSFLPRVSPGYDQLPEVTRTQYRIGVGQILGKWSATKSMYSHLAEDAIAAGLADGLRMKPYKLLADAFLVDSDNYRTDTLNRLFKRFGFDDAFAWVRNSNSISEFCTLNLGTETPDSYLNEFVRTRNEAAHGSTTSIASLRDIVNYADFAVLVVGTLASLLRSNMIRSGVSAGCSQDLGKVLHAYSGNVVGVEASSTATIAVGDKLYAGRKQIDPVIVIDLRILVRQ